LICLALSSSYPVSTAHIRFYTRLYSTFPVSPAATQQGTGTGSAQLGVRRHRREGAQRAVRGHPQGRHLAVQAGQQAGPRLGEEDPGARHQLPADGEHPALPGGGQEVRRARRGDLPDGRSLRAPQHPPGHPLPLRPWTHRKYYLG